MMIAYNVGAALLMGLVLFGWFGLEVFYSLTRSRERVPVKRWHAEERLSVSRSWEALKR